MENQKIINLLDKIDTNSKHFATQKWHIINDENNSSATLHQYKRDEPPEDDAVADLAADNSSSLKYKISLLGNPVAANNIARIIVKILSYH